MIEAARNIDLNKLPSHVGVIMDGNGRWAVQKRLPRTGGHSEGLKRAKDIAKAASDLGIKYLTLYAFSTENWKRTRQEVGLLMGLIHSHLRQELDFYRENQIRVRLLGDMSGLPIDVQHDIMEAQKDTESFSGTTVCLAINYGGRDEIIRGIRKLASEGFSMDEVTEQSLSDAFDVPELPDVDLMIRTGGEQRLSNFLLWKSAYAELIFSKTLWPDYGKEEFLKDIGEFQTRNRRFGAAPA